MISCSFQSWRNWNRFKLKFAELVPKRFLCKLIFSVSKLLTPALSLSLSLSLSAQSPKPNPKTISSLKCFCMNEWIWCPTDEAWNWNCKIIFFQRNFQLLLFLESWNWSRVEDITRHILLMIMIDDRNDPNVWRSGIFEKAGLPNEYTWRLIYS